VACQNTTENIPHFPKKLFKRAIAKSDGLKQKEVSFDVLAFFQLLT